MPPCRPAAGRSSSGPLVIRTVPAGSWTGPGDRLTTQAMSPRRNAEHAVRLGGEPVQRFVVADEAVAAQGDDVAVEREHRRRVVVLGGDR